ncbi:MAG TPA: hypothetical protein VF772_13260, partial [Terriglobales bacterium]
IASSQRRRMTPNGRLPLVPLVRRTAGFGVRREKAALSSGCEAHPAISLPPEATGAGMEVTKWLKPSGSGSRIGDRASVQAATRVNAEQASHDEGLVKGSYRRTSKRLQLLRYPRSKPICATRPVSEHGQPHMRSPLIAAAPRSRFRRAGLRKTRTILESGISGHGLLRFVYLDPPGLIRSWEMTELRWCIR